MSKRALIGVLLLTACGSDGESASPSDQQRSIDVAEKCSTRSLKDCASDSECMTLSAMAVDADHECLRSEVPVVCTKKNLGCDTALTIVEVASKRYRMNVICDTPGIDVVDASFAQGTPEFKQLAWSNCAAQTVPSECAAGTTKFSPGCGSPQLPAVGCYASCDAVGDASCAAGTTCQEAWIDPCVAEPGEISCEACGHLVHLCLAAPHDTPSSCSTGTSLFSPGCSEPKPTWEKGCYGSCSAVGDDAACAPGHTCQQTTVDPCVPKPGDTNTCAACGSLTHLCLPAPAGS